MKKSLSLILGLALVGAAIIPFSEASRNAYHAYLTQTGEDSNRFNDGRTRKNSVKHFNLKKDHRSVGYYRNYRGSRQSFSRSNTIKSNSIINSKVSVSRPSTLRWAPKSSAASLKRGSLFIRNLKNQHIPFYTYENQEFSLQIPKGWNNSTKTPHTYINPESDLSISTKKFPKGSCSLSESLTACTIKLSKAENNAAIKSSGKLLTTSRIIRQFYKTDGILDKSGASSYVVTESFSAQGLNQQVYINRYYIQDVDGDIFFVETKTAPKNAQKYLAISNTIFDSFRIYSQK